MGNRKKPTPKPEKPTTSRMTEELADKAFKTLRLATSLNQHINPGDQVARAAMPYPILDRLNRVIDATYPGKINLSGNIMNVLPNANRSITLKYFDLGTTDLRFNYQYHAIKSTASNKAVNIQANKSIAEALAKVSSEIFTSLPFFACGYYSDMPHAYVSGLEVEGDAYLPFFDWYQVMMSNILLIPARYNALMAVIDQMKDMGYNREAYVIEELRGLLSKKAFISQINAISDITKGEYFDRPWFSQINTIVNSFSKKSMGMRDPLLTIDGTCILPDIEVYASKRAEDPNNPGYVDPNDTTPKLFSTHTYDYVVGSADALKTIRQYGCQYPGIGAEPNPNYDPTDPDSQPYLTTVYRISDVILAVLNMLNPVNIQIWARRTVTGKLDLDKEPHTANGYFNMIKDMLEIIRGKYVRFTSDTADLKTMLDVAQRADMNRWEPGIMLLADGRVKDTFKFNKLVQDIFTNRFSTTSGLHWDENVQHWQFKTLWDEFLGIPEYDKVVGGSFLTFSNHPITVDEGDTGDEVKYLVPILYSTAGKEATFADRKGNVIKVNSAYVSLASTLIGRLNLLQDPNFDRVYIPLAVFPASDDGADADTSTMLQMLTNVFGVGAVQFVNGDAETVTVSASNPTVMGYIDVTMEDITNDMIVYYQTYSPLRVYSSSGFRTVGFISPSDVSPIR